MELLNFCVVHILSLRRNNSHNTVCVGPSLLVNNHSYFGIDFHFMLLEIVGRFEEFDPFVA